MSLRSGLTAALLVMPALAPAATRTWPGVAPCNGTLQACVNAAANGDRIQIATEVAIDESLSLVRSLSLVAAAGFHPSLVAGREIIAWSNAANVDIILSGLRVSDASVIARYDGTGTANYYLVGLELSQSSGGAPTYLRVEANAGTVNALLYDNRVTGRPPTDNSGLIEIRNYGATLNANAYYNHLSHNSPVVVTGAGLFISVLANGAGAFLLHGNQVRGGFFSSGIFVSEGAGLFPTASTFSVRAYSNLVVGSDYSSAGGGGMSFVVKNGTIDVQAVNNTVTRCYDGITATQWSGGGATARVDGTTSNNLIVASQGLQFAPAVTPSLGNDYNLINASSNSATLGSHTVTAPAQLASDTVPRLRPGSPAIDAADTASLVLGLTSNGLPALDADGLRRIKGATAQADIGAFELGDLGLLHTGSSANIVGHITTISHNATNGRTEADLLVTPSFNGGVGAGVANNHPFGVYYSFVFSRWRLFNQDLSAMPLGAHFNAFVPAPGSGLFRHVSNATNTAGSRTQLDDASVNDLPGHIVLVTQNWTAGGAGVYNPHPIGLSYYGLVGGSGYFFIDNADLQSMPLNAGFNVYSQEASPNAFRVTAADAAAFSILLDHPLLNGIPCAQVQATRLINDFDPPVSGNFDVFYTGGRWRIYGYGGMPVGTVFNVLVNPAQVSDCTDLIFADGFEG